MDDSTSEIPLRSLCELLGSTEGELIGSLGEPDEDETNEYGTRFLFYTQYKTLFTITVDSGTAKYIEGPITSSFGTRMKPGDGAFQVDGIRLGDSEAQVEAIWGPATERIGRRMVFGNRSGNAKTGASYEVSVTFGDAYDDGHEGVSQIAGRLGEPESAITPDSSGSPTTSPPAVVSGSGGGCLLVLVVGVACALAAGLLSA